MKAGCAPRWLRLRVFAANDRANIAIEFALVAPILVFLLMNILDFSRLIWARMEVDNAARMGAQAAFKSCSSGTLPATTNCSGLSTTVTTAVQSTSLGTAVTVLPSGSPGFPTGNYSSGNPPEDYYCVSGTSLTWVAKYSSSPGTCSGGGTPGDYIEIDVSYSYSPVFSGLTLASSRTLTGTAITRLG
jgi:Flp pilus assembly protein TadG